MWVVVVWDLEGYVEDVVGPFPSEASAYRYLEKFEMEEEEAIVVAFTNPN